MAVIEGGTYGPGDSFPDGTIFIGCTFYSPCYFGEGCLFENCNFYEDGPDHQVGAGATMTGGYVQDTVFGEAAQLYNVSVGEDVTFGADSKQNGSIITQTGAALNYAGVNPAQGRTSFDPNWRCKWSCKSPYINVTITGVVNAPVKVTEAGTVYTIPSSG